jgi:hypothetical protein
MTMSGRPSKPAGTTTAMGDDIMSTPMRQVTPASLEGLPRRGMKLCQNLVFSPQCILGWVTAAPLEA